MKYEEIIKLLDAGYSRAEIIEMSKDPEPKDPKPEDPKPEDLKSENSDIILGELKTLFEDMKKEFTAMNILSSRQREEEAITADSAIANIINPFKKKEG